MQKIKRISYKINMKNFLYIFLFFAFVSCSLFADSFSCALGKANTSATFGTFSIDDYWECTFETSLSDGGWSCNCDKDNRSIYCYMDGAFGWNELYTIWNSRTSAFHSPPHLISPGVHVVSAHAYNSLSCNHDWGVVLTLTVNKIAKCPDTRFCVTYVCPYCNEVICSVHKRHITVLKSHNFNSVPGTEEKEHSHCTNSENLAAQWSSLASLRTCSACGMTFCPLCPHLCGDYRCPNTPNCNKQTCGVCSGEYCTVHSFHLCSNFHSAGLSAMSNLISVQTSVAGQAIVNVQIQPGQGLDFSELSSAMASVEGAINSSSSSIVSQLGSLSMSVDGLNSGISSISNSVTNLNSTVSSSSAGIKEAINTQGGLIVQANNETKSEVTTQGEALLSSSSEIRDAILSLEERMDYNSSVVSENITTELSGNHETDQAVQDSIESEQKETNSFLDRMLGLLEGEDSSSGDPQDPEDPGSGGGDISLPEIIDYQDINESAQAYQFDINIVALQTIKDKLLISSALKNYGGSSSISFNIPMLDDTYSIDFLSNETSTVRSFVRAACAFGYCLSFLFACLKTIKSF